MHGQMTCLYLKALGPLTHLRVPNSATQNSRNPQIILFQLKTSASARLSELGAELWSEVSSPPQLRRFGGRSVRAGSQGNLGARSQARGAPDAATWPTPPGGRMGAVVHAVRSGLGGGI